MLDEKYMQEQDPVIVDTKKETDKKCDSCGGTMNFDPASGLLLCPYCGGTKEIKVNEEKFVAKELDYFSGAEGNSCDWGTETKTVVCKGCGAETVYRAKDIANSCPYCGSNQVMEASAENVMAPGGVVLFRIDAKTASQCFKNWIGRQFFCPRQAKQSAKPKAFQGLYIPYWTFDTKTNSQYYGQYGRQRTVKVDGKTVTKTEWYSTNGHYQIHFDDILVCGASDKNQQMLERIEPYDTKQVVEYKPEYMAGFVAESYTVKAKTAWERAKTKIASTIREGIRNKIQREHNTAHARVLNVQTSYLDVTYKYLLLPVWISSFQYNGKIYQFMINGQTGEVYGKTPISWQKVLMLIGAALLAFFLIWGTLEGCFF